MNEYLQDKINQIDQSDYEFFVHFLSVIVFLLLSLLLGVWIMQKSINAYYLQTYNKVSPLQLDYGFWKKGEDIGDYLYQQHEMIAQRVVGFNDRVIHSYNNKNNLNANEEIQEQEIVQEVSYSLAYEHQEEPQEEIIAVEPVFENSLKLTNKEKVFFAGDSMMQGIAPHMQKYLQRHDIDSINLSKQSTGLSYTKFFDWNKTIKQTINKDKSIKLLIIMLGPNDPGDFYKEGKHLRFGSEAWNDEYQSRMNDIIDFSKSKNVSIIWITPPNMKKDTLNKQMNHLNDVMTDALERQNIKVVDSRPIMGGINNRYNDYLVKDGKKIKMRTNDGIHFTPEGQRILAREIQSLLIIE